LAGFAIRVWQVEQHLEAVLAAQPLGGVRGIPATPGGDQQERARGAILRQYCGARTCFGRRRKRGQQNQALGRSRGGFSSKIHLKTDFDGLPIAFHLTGGEVSDTTQLEISLDIGPDITPRAAITDKGYDSAANRAACRRRGIVPVIPYRENAKNKPNFFPRLLYKTRARVEQTIGKLKRFKRVAMRCDKTQESYGAFVAFACTLILVKSVHRA
jgi:transposase